MPILDDAQIASFFALEEVQAAKHKIDAKKSEGSVYFTIAMTETIKTILKESFGLELPATATTVPMRWIKGDIKPHIDVGAANFDTTHLMYLTDSPGELVVGGTSYPITKGSAHVFPESVRHETINTGSEPRLLLGPMSEEGFAVGLPPPTDIDGSGGTTVYIHQAGGNNEYSYDQIDWYLFAMPTTITNTNTGAGMFTVEFVTDISFNVSDNYFICNTSNIQFGSTSLKVDGSRPVFTIDGVDGYPGLIQNGSDGNDGYSGIKVFNLVVDVSGSTLADGGGWIGQEYFGNAANNNYIVNCSSNGPISIDGGGIVGRSAGSGAEASLILLGCSSLGNCDDNAGGIAGRYAGENSGSIRCESCWSTGFIGNEGGGITGENTQNATIRNCYSTGEIDDESGGICGQGCENSTIENCYSTGEIGAGAGGIVGDSADTVIITNCYSIGGENASDGGGILGNNSTDCTITHCYTVGAVTGEVGYIISGSAEIPATCFSEDASGSAGEWSSTNANTVLEGFPAPILGETWVDVSSGAPYELGNMGYTPYTIQNIDLIEGDPVLNRGITSSVAAGSATAGGIVPGKAYTLLDISQGDTGSYSSITIDPATGVISTTAATAPGLYVIFLRNNGSYNITGYGLTVTEAVAITGIPCCARPTFRRGPLIDNATLTALTAGNTYIGSVRRNGTNISYAQIMAAKKAKASKS